MRRPDDLGRREDGDVEGHGFDRLFVRVEPQRRDDLLRHDPFCARGRDFSTRLDLGLVSRAGNLGFGCLLP